MKEASNVSEGVSERVTVRVDSCDDDRVSVTEVERVVGVGVLVSADNVVVSLMLLLVRLIEYVLLIVCRSLSDPRECVSLVLETLLLPVTS